MPPEQGVGVAQQDPLLIRYTVTLFSIYFSYLFSFTKNNGKFVNLNGLTVISISPQLVYILFIYYLYYD